MTAMEQVINIPLTDIFSDSDFNSRGDFAPIDCMSLAKDIRENGLLQPIIVREIENVKGRKYVVVAGHRRYTAFQINSMPEIPAIVRKMTDDEAIVANFSENLSREDLDIVQEAQALAKLQKRGWNLKLLEEKLGLSRYWFQVREALVKMPPEIQQEAKAGILTQHHIMKLGKMKSTEEQYAAVRQIKERLAAGEKRSAIEIGTKKKRDVTRPVVRKKSEIQNAIEWYLEEFEEGPVTYFLAWAAGNLSDLDLMLSLKRCHEGWEAPKDYTIPDMTRIIEIRPGEFR